jgi:Trypsin
MRRRAFALIFSAIVFAAAPPAGAVVNGTSSSLGRYMVRLDGGSGNCSGVAIARRAVVTARHCAYGMRVVAGGRYFRVAHVSRSGVLDDGRHVRVSGDAAILVLRAPLPAIVADAPIGDGGGASYIIAGYGTTNERYRSHFGVLHGATLVSAGANTLVDPNHSGLLGASACYGDSGGAVMRGGVLVGVITRATYPRKRIACGKFTRWAPISVSGAAETLATK